MLDISSLFSLDGDAALPSTVGVNSKNANGSGEFAAQVAAFMGQGGETSEISADGKNIPLQSTTKDADAENTDVSSETAIPGNIDPLRITAPTFFPAPVQETGSAPAENIPPAPVMQDTEQPDTMIPAPLPYFTDGQPAVSIPQELPVQTGNTIQSPASGNVAAEMPAEPVATDVITNMSGAVAETAEAFISRLTTNRPSMNREPVVLPSHQPVAENRDEESRQSAPEPARLQFDAPIILDAQSSEPMPQAAPVTIYAQNVTPATVLREAAEGLTENTATEVPTETRVASSTGNSASTHYLNLEESVWSKLQLPLVETAQQVQPTQPEETLAEETVPEEAVPELAEAEIMPETEERPQLKVDNIFHKPLEMTVKVGKPLMESVPQTTVAASQTDIVRLDEGGEEPPVRPEAKIQDTRQLQTPPEKVVRETAAAPQQSAEIKNIKPETPEEKPVAAKTDNTLLQEAKVQPVFRDNNQGQQNNPNAQSNNGQNVMASNSQNVPPKPEMPTNQMSANQMPANRMTVAGGKDTQKEQLPQTEPQGNQISEGTEFRLPEQPQEQAREAKAEERILRWESVKDAANLAKMIQQAGQNGVTKLTVRLTPENLGRLEIQLTEVGGRIDAKILANSTESRALLASNGEAIRQQLADKGIQINTMDFSFHDSLARQDQNDHGQAGQEAKRGKFVLNRDESEATFENAVAQQQEENAAGRLYA